MATHSHLVVEDHGFCGGGGGDEMLVDDGHDVVADAGELRLHLVPVVLDPARVVVVPFRVFLLLDGREDPPRGPAGADHVLVADGEEVPLLNRELHVEIRDILHRIHHLCNTIQYRQG